MMDMGINQPPAVTVNRPAPEPHPMEVRTYLQRIKYHGLLTPSLDALRALYVAHCQTVPYENVDLCLGRSPELTEAALFNKIVRQWRGGVNSELNGLFVALLRALGFSATLVAAQRVDDTGFPKSETLHSMVLVNLEQRWLLDVGSWDTPGMFLALDDGEVAHFAPAYRVTQNGPLWTVWKHIQDDHWRERYLLHLKTRPLTNFAPANLNGASTQENTLVEHLICALETPTGRLTVRHARLTIVSQGQLQEQYTLNRDNWRAALHSYFGIELPGEVKA